MMETAVNLRLQTAARVKNVYLGSTRKVTSDQALEKARKLKARALERLRAERSKELKREAESKPIWEIWRS